MIATRTALALALLGALALPSWSVQDLQDQAWPGVQMTQDQDHYVFEFSKDGMKFEPFIDMVSKMLGRTLTYDDRRLNGNNKRINVVGRSEVPKAKLRGFFEEVLFAHNMALIPLSWRPDCVMIVEDIQTSQLLKSRGLFIEEEDLSLCAERPGGIFLCVIPLEFVKAEDCQRALNNIIQEHRAGFVHPIASANSIIICNFGSTLVTMYETLKAMEAAAQSDRAKRYHEANPEEVESSEDK